MPRRKKILLKSGKTEEYSVLTGIELTHKILEGDAPYWWVCFLDTSTPKLYVLKSLGRWLYLCPACTNQERIHMYASGDRESAFGDAGNHAKTHHGVRL
jgi:hypothetical protein